TVTANITTCRIKIECPTNIFFDINDFNFTITATTTGINQISSQNMLGLSVAPNPFTSVITINAANRSGEAALITVTDLLGKIILQESAEGTGIHKELNLQNVESGIYFISIKTKSHQAVAKVIKQ
ncbi:MAG TPA: T9SS type A sorting domain-containing protein, partial [Bacteroidia bacterium]|nr:T9SS type A sorting domain-containing protein [Bacteroidia bacterium]